MAALGTMCHIPNRFRELYLLTKSLTKSLLVTAPVGRMNSIKSFPIIQSCNVCGRKRKQSYPAVYTMSCKSE